ncbi:MAG: dihydropteroate synthase [Candidatus Omnitrophota bacterium]
MSNITLATPCASIARKEFQWQCGPRRLALGKNTKIMAILNVTPDSFSHDGVYRDPLKAVEKALAMERDGADIIDVGGESTRPGAEAITVAEEQERVLPVVKQLAKVLKVPISIDTTHSQTAAAALGEGASIVNDISGLSFDYKMAKVVAQHQAGCILMHIQGTPQTMQQNPSYRSLINEISQGLKQNISKAEKAGMAKQCLVIDPGIGFGKTTAHNLEILNRLNELVRLGLPILVGPSRKSFIGNILKADVEQRLIGTIACVTVAILHGAHIVRVHDVKAIKETVKMTDAILDSGSMA